MQNAEAGIFKLEVGNKIFNLKASFKNMSKIASAIEIVSIYESLHREDTAMWYRLALARDVLICCSDNKKIDKYLIQTNGMRVRVKAGQITSNDQVLVACSLMRHGMAGVNSPEYENSGAGGDLVEFDVNKIVSDAMIHFRLTEDQAMELTMTKFRLLLASKFPPVKRDAPTIKQHHESLDPKELGDGLKWIEENEAKLLAKIKDTGSMY